MKALFAVLQANTNPLEFLQKAIPINDVVFFAREQVQEDTTANVQNNVKPLQQTVGKIFSTRCLNL